MSSGDHKKKHEHRKRSGSLPPDMLPDGGFKSRIHGVPGSTPGCTAGAYAKTLDPEGLPDIVLKTCFPDQYAAAKKWLSDSHPKTLQIFLTGFRPEPTIADVVNKWLIRRVGRKCIEGTEEGRKDMEAFCVDMLKRLRKIDQCSVKLYRAVPWSAMGKLAPGLSEFEEETNIVWPTFTSLTKNEKFAREMLKDEGGILFVVDTDQARDVSEFTPVLESGETHQETEYMLEPNSVFTITANKNEDKVFVVEMKQNVPSARPIMKEIEKHHHHESRSPSTDPSEASSSYSTPQSPVTPRTDRSHTVVTPVMRRVPTMSATPLTRKNSLPLEGSSNSTPGSPRFPRSSSRLAIPQSPRGPTKLLSHPKHRVLVNNSTPSMTMWSAARGYIKVYSTNSRSKVKAFTPSWAKPKEEKKKDEEEKPKDEKDEEDKDKKDKKDKKKDKKKKKEKEKGKDEGSPTPPPPVETKKLDVADDVCSPPVSPTTPGYGTMPLCPNSAPTYIIDDRTVDFRTLGGIILHSTRGTPVIVMSLH